MEVRNTSSKYTSTLIAFMSFIDGVKYDATSSFSRDKLLAITADQVAAYLNYKAYGTPTPGPTDRPTQGRGTIKLPRLSQKSHITFHASPHHDMGQDQSTRKPHTLCRC